VRKMFPICALEGTRPAASLAQNGFGGCPFHVLTTIGSPQLIYEPFFDDFGPVHLGMLYRFCKQLQDLLDDK
jgi:hypothetical protein